MESEASRQQYGYTYNIWKEWCEWKAFDPVLAINMQNVTQYLKDLKVSYTTRKNHLAHLRKLVKFLSIYHDEFKKRYEELMYMKTPKQGANTNERQTKALPQDDVEALLTAWDDDVSLKGVRNNALIRLTFATGARISEIAAVKWTDIDEYQETLNIPHGKGDKERTATIVRDAAALPALYRLAKQLPESYQHCFPSILKSGKPGKDKPMTRQSLHRIVTETGEIADVDFHHHLARKTLGTELFRNGGEAIIRDVMEQFGHENPKTLLEHYVAPENASRRHDKFKTSWNE